MNEHKITNSKNLSNQIKNNFIREIAHNYFMHFVLFKKSIQNIHRCMIFFSKCV